MSRFEHPRQSTVNSAGKGQASASNSVLLKRRRRHSQSLATLAAIEAKDWWESVPMAKSAGENNLYVHKRRRRHSRNLDIMTAKHWRPRENSRLQFRPECDELISIKLYRLIRHVARIETKRRTTKNLATLAEMEANWWESVPMAKSARGELEIFNTQAFD
uniref:Uncharacterized protein n=1 Tax=Globodera pallida TaxID=36090 RepID=A0A183BSX0_GLOPA